MDNLTSFIIFDITFTGGLKMSWDPKELTEDERTKRRAALWIEVLQMPAKAGKRSNNTNGISTARWVRETYPDHFLPMVIGIRKAFEKLMSEREEVDAKKVAQRPRLATSTDRESLARAVETAAKVEEKQEGGEKGPLGAHEDGH